MDILEKSKAITFTPEYPLPVSFALYFAIFVKYALRVFLLPQTAL
jgi:hypothetical protein